MRWVVAFNGSRDGYQVPLALEEAGRLETLVTDWYSPLDRRWARFAARLLPARVVGALERRYHPGLPSSRVSALSLRSVLRSRFGAGRVSALDELIGVRAGELARSRGAGILSYSYYAHAAFCAYGAGPHPRAIFQVHPHPASLRRLFREEMEREPDCSESLSAELEMRMEEPAFARMCEEPHLADFCLVASEYTKATLVENGVDGSRVTVVPYGVDLERFRPAQEPPSGPFRVLFIGQMTQRKGLKHLLETWRQLALPNAELVLAGRGITDRALLARYEGTYTLRTGVSSGELRRLYQTSDVFCMPSLAEGFGLVYLEALACGTPVIATPNTGAADLVTDGQEGFIVGMRDVDALRERLAWCYEHRAELREMRPRARRLAERHSWPAFRKAVAGAMAELERCAPAGSPAHAAPAGRG